MPIDVSVGHEVAFADLLVIGLGVLAVVAVLAICMDVDTEESVLTAKPRKPLLVSVTKAAGISVLFLVCYVFAYAEWIRLWTRGHVSDGVGEAITRTVFLPVDSWCARDMPGSEFLSHFVGWWVIQFK